jgi:predicted dehydrogenase
MMNALSPREFKLGIVGLDTSHVRVFGEAFNNPGSANALKGARVVAAWPGGSPDLEASIGTVPFYTSELRDKFGVRILDSIEAVVAESDGILLTSLDGRVHRVQFERIAPSGKPVFIDKPFATNSADARAIFATARRNNVRMFTSSSLRFAEAVTRVVTPATRAAITGADFCGPVALEPTNPGLFWYGIHPVEMLYTALGRGCRSVRCVSNATHDLATGVWGDGRIGTIRGNRTDNNDYYGLVHFAKNSAAVNVQAPAKWFFTSLAEAILAFMKGGPIPVEPEETLEIIRFIEAANESGANGGREVLL